MNALLVGPSRLQPYEAMTIPEPAPDPLKVPDVAGGRQVVRIYRRVSMDAQAALDLFTRGFDVAYEYVATEPLYPMEAPR